jgi:hypothetical protein
LTDWNPQRTALVAYQDHQIRVYGDATWEPVAGHPAGWVIHRDAVVHSTGAGDARITTSWGHSKASLVSGPDGTDYDVRALASTPAA